MLYHYLKGNILHLSPLVIERILRNADKTSKNGKFDHFFYITLFDDKMLYFHNENAKVTKSFEFSIFYQKNVILSDP